ncbi:Aureobasidin A1 biosynthesis complex [Hoyosella sp. G463]|uniref:Aureobasidin A1 biosynthesis complex n=1 Tax=Lolliginicoccus lacisalsi TaxID=2742202 RepID=A0A927JBX7_9ACTN|nr:condensation domain-containing protein [Lolliginicoccus lacisalsi]MBD8506483.1 Aureobasidin A1 biosynthesis complex [Lolliginicoccus lacisalsi]
MEYTELDQYPLPDGRLTTWTPVVARGAWAPDARPLSSAHREHCDRADRTTDRPGRGSWIGSAFRIERPYSPEAMRALITTWFARHEALRTTVLPTPAGWARQTLPVDAIDAVPVPVLRARTGAEARDFLTEQFETALSPLSWPHCILATVEPGPLEPGSDDGSFLCIFGADHSVMDAYSQVIAISELRALYNDIVDGTHHTTAKAYGSHLDFAVVEQKACEALTTEAPAVQAWRDFLAQHDHQFPAFGPVEPATATSRQASLSRWLLDLDEAQALNTACRAHGFSSQAGILAALALAQARTGGGTRFSTIMPVHTRVHESWAESMGWFVNIVPLELTVAHGNDLPGALQSATRALAATKPLALAPFARVAELLGTTATPRFVVSYVDIRYLPEADRMPDIQGRALRSNSYSSNEVYFWINRTPHGLNVSTRYPDTPQAHLAIEMFLSELATVLRSASTTPIAA